MDNFAFNISGELMPVYMALRHYSYAVMCSHIVLWWLRTPKSGGALNVFPQSLDHGNKHIFSGGLSPRLL